MIEGTELEKGFNGASHRHTLKPIRNYRSSYCITNNLQIQYLARKGVEQ